MNTCWKCEAEIPMGATECVACQEGVPALEGMDEEALDKEFRQNWLEVDWTKVETLRDLIAILAKHGQPIFIQKGTPEHDELKKFLKPIE